MGVLPAFICAALALAIATGMWLVGVLIGPRRGGAVKQMPYESGMDPIHDARRRFDVRFHVVAIVFLIFDVEVLFIYPWAVASHHPTAGIDQAVAAGWVSGRGVVFGGVLLFLALVVAGLVYEWRKGVLRWR
jgi:NADH-quinone oxidoreductase subunit A